MRLDNEVLADKNEVDKDEIGKNKPESHMFAGFMTLAL